MPYPAGITLDAVLSLVETTWPGLPRRIRRAGELGWAWEAVSTPFVAEAHGRIVSHVGVLEYDLMIAGERVPAAGVHAVCTEPGERGKGHARGLLEEAMAWIDARGLVAVLATDVPAVYEPHGFEVVPERRWRLPAAGRGGASRPLSAGEPRDVALLCDLYARRTPISQELCTLAPVWMFGICEVLETGGLSHLRYAPALDAILAWQRISDGTVVLMDVIASALPPLADLLEHLPEGAPVELAFCVDGFGEDSVRARGGEPAPAPADDLWMARGVAPRVVGQMPMLARH